MSKLLKPWVCMLLVVTGCTSTPPAWKKKPAPPTDRVVTNAVTMPVAVSPAIAPPQTNLPPAPVVVVQPALNPNDFPESWISINRWAQARHLAAPRKVTLEDGIGFTVHTDNGDVELLADSLLAYWDDVQINLGFAPQLIGGQLFVHRLDLFKNLEPLLKTPVMDRKNRTIVIDPGHGGMNAGTASVLGDQWEKQFTLDWALRLAPLLETNGWQVFLTRTNDVDVSLAERVAYAEARHADLFISLHFNSVAPDESESGVETYCLTPKGMASTLTREYSDDVTQIFPNNSHDAENWSWAFQLHRALLRSNLCLDRGVRHARFMGVLRGQNRPAVLIEGGYLSNPAEARRIADPAFRQKLAETLAGALK